MNILVDWLIIINWSIVQDVLVYTGLYYKSVQAVANETLMKCNAVDVYIVTVAQFTDLWNVLTAQALHFCRHYRAVLTVTPKINSVKINICSHISLFM